MITLNTGMAQLLVSELKKGNKTVSIAESCTGGLLAATIVCASGASEVFKHGEVTYCNEAKEKYLGVSRYSLDKHTAVSYQVAMEMANGIRELDDADFGIGITGYAEIDDKMPEEKRGLVYIAIATREPKNTFILKRIYTQSRNKNRSAIVDDALRGLWQIIHQEEPNNED